MSRANAAKAAQTPPPVKPARVWIELDRPDTEAEGDRWAGLANQMLARLRNGAPGGEFWWDQQRLIYCYGDNGGFVECADRGQWFNLEYLAKDRPATGATLPDS